jgi:hypothetical protein
VTRKICAILSMLLPLLLASPAVAQFAQRGSVDGFVFDSSGAAVVGAQVTLVDIGQKQARETVTDKNGHFSFSNVTAAQYELDASAPDFETSKSEPITINIGSNRRYDFKLNAGKVSQSVTVSSDTQALETGQASLNTNVSEQQMKDLPLNGRNFTAVAALVPGVATTPQLNVNPGGTYAVGATFATGGTAYTVGGLVEGSRDNGFYLNGVNITENYESTISYAPSTEAITTATIQVADLSAANGHDVSTLTLQTKGGSTSFHGEAYDYIENSALNAVNPFDKAESDILQGGAATVPNLRRNQYGGGLGGPVFIPKLLPSLRDKLFFFANYENFVESDGSEPLYTEVPSIPERTGDFSELLTGPTPLQLYNPFYTTYNSEGYSSRPAIPNNRLDLASRPDGSPVVAPGSAALLALYPDPNIQGTPSYLPNYYATEHGGFSNYHFDSRFDAHVTQNDFVFVTWSKSHGDNNNSGGIPPSNLYIQDIDDKAYLVTVNYAHVFTPRLTNEFIFGIGDGALINLSPSEFSYLNSSENPLNQIFQNTGQGLTEGVLQMSVYNYASPGFNSAFRAENRTFQISDNADLIHGRHSISLGFNYFRKGEYDWSFVRYVTFGESSEDIGSVRQEFSSGGYQQNYAGGDGIADLVMGTPQVIHQRYNFVGGNATSPELDVVFPYWGAYVNDKFQVNPRLTISAGLRYDLAIPLYAQNSLCCALYTPTSDGGILKIPGIAAGVPQHFLSAPKLDFAPRVSIAYSPTDTLVLRAGYGIFYDSGATQISNALGYTTQGVPGYNIGDELSNVNLGYPADTPVLNLSQIFQAQPNLTPGQYPVSTGPGQGYFGAGQETPIYYLDQKSTPLPYYQRMIADAQKQLTPQDTVTLSYIGAQGRKGSNFVNTNLPPYQTGWPSQNAFNAARPNNLGRFSDIYVERPTLNSFYNAAVIQYNRQFNRGLQLVSNYTWSKTVSDYPWLNTVEGYIVEGEGTGFQYPNIRNRGESTLSHRHRFVYSGIWEPSYGAAWHQWAKVAVTGWRISVIGTLESGDVLTVNNVLTTAADYAGIDTLNIRPGESPNLSHGQKTFTQQFNVSAFSAPPNGVRGNSGLGTVRGPGQNNLDLSVAKTFPIYKTVHLDFRADAFNALNHTQWDAAQTTYPYGPSASGAYGNIPFGQVSGAREARIMQLGFKLAF